MQILDNLSAATLVTGQESYGLIADAAIVLDDDRITWIGPRDDLPAEFRSAARVDYQKRLVTPALIDCHTHLVFGGNRANEFEMRLNGATYEEIARAGGGIRSTVRATREASAETLLESALERIDRLCAEGVGTIEIKSGYGLDSETELKMLSVARTCQSLRDITVKTTFLGAHAVPDAMAADHYIDTVCIPALRQAAQQGLVDAVDGFCETIAFTPAQIGRVFDIARELHLPVKLHTDQLNDIGGTSLVETHQALSADHIEYADETGIQRLARSGAVAVLLPGAFYTLRETRLPPLDLLRRHQVAMAVATDLNPGSSPLNSLLLAMNMACTLFGLSPQEALAGTTREAARALGLNDRGQLRAGLRADVAVWDVESPAELSYHIAYNPLHQRYHAGRLVAA